ncbi:hypothetical protein IEQ34_027074 [Dendrobium chrysotoxum]|uniref:Autophagy-related protein n=1 Tax=Dendrobium chrysotoxum TaxID=161865 RepID=A0AAV7FI65_DENCH|nr:hypothetical protein IEQ34_027074 [Dendrobium chrysotoxum]
MAKESLKRASSLLSSSRKFVLSYMKTQWEHVAGFLALYNSKRSKEWRKISDKDLERDDECVLHSQPKSTVGTRIYSAPEILLKNIMASYFSHIHTQDALRHVFTSRIADMKDSPEKQISKELAYQLWWGSIWWIRMGNDYSSIFSRGVEDCEEIYENPKKLKKLDFLDRSIYLVPAYLKVGQFVYVIRKRIELSAKKAIFIFVDNVVLPIGSVLSKIYEEKDKDGFLCHIQRREYIWSSHF